MLLLSVAAILVVIRVSTPKDDRQKPTNKDPFEAWREARERRKRFEKLHPNCLNIDPIYRGFWEDELYTAQYYLYLSDDYETTAVSWREYYERFGRYSYS